MEVMDELSVTVIAQYHEHFSYSDYHWNSVCYSNGDMESIDIHVTASIKGHLKPPSQFSG